MTSGLQGDGGSDEEEGQRAGVERAESKQREIGGAANEAEGEEMGRDAGEDADRRAERAARGEDAGGNAEG